MFIKYLKIIVIFFPLVLISLSCSNKSEQALTGVWEIEELKISMQTFSNSDSTVVIEANGKNWEEKMRSRNIRTYYNNDGTYHSVHKDLQDNITYDPAGKWKIVKDSLFISDTFPEPVSYKFKIKLNGDQVEYWGTSDFDQDGQTDDAYYSKQRRIE